MNLLRIERMLEQGIMNTLPHVRVAPTAIPGKPSKFWVGIPQKDREEYSRFCSGVLRLESQGKIRYLVFRNGRNPRPDLGRGKFDLTRPSSVILGHMDGQGGFKPKVQIHWATDLPIGATETDAAAYLLNLVRAEFYNGNPA